MNKYWKRKFATKEDREIFERNLREKGIIYQDRDSVVFDRVLTDVEMKEVESKLGVFTVGKEIAPKYPPGKRVRIYK